jgi:hypothetical protein
MLEKVHTHFYNIVSYLNKNKESLNDLNDLISSKELKNNIEYNK